MKLRDFLVCAVLTLPSAGADALDRVLYLYNWSEYLPESVLEGFERESGIKVVYSTFDSNEAMYAKLRLVGERNSYDLVVPSTYYVSKMRKEGLLAKIDKSRLANFKQLDPRLLDRAFDPGNEHSVPYLWGSTGIALNTGKVRRGSVTRWADLWRAEFRDRLLLTNDMREVFHVGLRVLGYSGNSTDPKEIEAAYKKLMTLVPNVRVYNSEAPRMTYLEGEADAGMIWNGEAYQAHGEDPLLEYVYPEEGAVLWMDSLVIPRTARNVDNAYLFIDYLLRPEVGKAITEEIGYATPNMGSLALLDDAMRNNRTVFRPLPISITPSSRSTSAMPLRSTNSTGSC